jgi:hypothetical protein
LQRRQAEHAAAGRRGDRAPLPLLRRGARVERATQGQGRRRRRKGLCAAGGHRHQQRELADRDVHFLLATTTGCGSRLQRFLDFLEFEVEEIQIEYNADTILNTIGHKNLYLY